MTRHWGCHFIFFDSSDFYTTSNMLESTIISSTRFVSSAYAIITIQPFLNMTFEMPSSDDLFFSSPWDVFLSFDSKWFKPSIDCNHWCHELLEFGGTMGGIFQNFMKNVRLKWFKFIGDRFFFKSELWMIAVVAIIPCRPLIWEPCWIVEAWFVICVWWSFIYLPN